MTGDIQVNDTDLHSPLKGKYRELEQSLMMLQLKADLKKIPQPSRDDMMRILVESFKSLEIDAESRLKALWVINALDDTEDYLVSERVMLLVVNKMEVFQNYSLKKKSPKNLKELLKPITPPKGVRRKVADTVPPIDEGQELFDCDGADLNYIDEASDDKCESDDEGNDQAEQPASPGNNQPPTTPVEPPAPVILADLYKGNPELKKDAAFPDTVGTMLANSKTSKQFLPFLNDFKRNYIAARRSLKSGYNIQKGKAVKKMTYW